MPAPKKYNDELRERATRLAVEARRDPASEAGAIRRIADQLGIHPEALRVWVKRAETDAGVRPGTTSADADRIAALEREVLYGVAGGLRAGRRCQWGSGGADGSAGRRLRCVRPCPARVRLWVQGSSARLVIW